MPLDGEDACTWVEETVRCGWWSAFSSSCCVVEAIARVLLILEVGVGVVQEIRDHLHGTLLQGDAAQSNHRRRRIVSE